MSSSKKSAATANKVTGVLLCRDRIAICTGGSGPSSAKALHGAASVFAEGELKSLLAEAISGELFSKKIAVGVDPLLEFFSTQRTAFFKDGDAAESLIDELRGKYGSRLVTEPLRTALPLKTHQTAIAVPRGELQETAEAFESFSGGRVKFISTTHAMYAMAADADPSPRKWKSEIRVFLGSHEGLVLFAVGGTLVARQIFEYSGQAQSAVTSAVNGMVIAVKEGLSLDSPDGVLFHVGKSDSTLADQCTSMTGIHAESCSQITYDQATLATALAFDGFRRKGQEIDFLHRATSSTKSSKEQLVPVVAVSVLSASILGSGAFLWNAGNAVQAEIDTYMAQAQDALDLYDGDLFLLEEAEEELMKTVSIGAGFLMDRVYWADFLSEIPKILPQGMTLRSLDAKYPFQAPDEDEDEDEEGGSISMARSKDNNYFILDLEMGLASRLSETPQILALSESLKESKLFSTTFSTIPVADMNRLKDETGWKLETTLRCTP